MKLAAIALVLATGWLWLGGSLPVMAAAAVPHPADEQIDQTLRDVLARQEFKQATPPWWTRLLADILKWFGSLSGGSPVMFWFVVVGGTLLLLLLLAQIGWTVRRVLFFSSGVTEDEAGQIRRERLSAGYFEEAGRCAARHDFTEAIRCLFLSLIYRFDESGTMTFPHATTNREYLEFFRGRQTHRDQLQVFVDTLDANWYGQHPTDQGEYERCLAMYRSLS